MKKHFFIGLVLAKLFFLIIVANLAPLFIPTQGVFSFPDVLDQYQLPNSIKSLANFDGVHYIRIAQEGYYQFGHAFFPLFPLLITIVSYLLLGNEILAGIIIANISFAFGLIFFYRWWQKNQSLPSFKWFAIFLLSFPTSFFFHSVYTESLFFLLVASVLYLASTKKFWWAAPLAILASLTRVTGIFLVFPLLLAHSFPKKKATYAIALFPLIGLGLYMIYLSLTVGDPLAFFHAQSAFGAGRTTEIILLPQVYARYIKILLLSDITFNYWIAATELLLFTLMFLTALLETWQQYLKKNWRLVAVGLFSLFILILPTLTGTLLSTPRFALLSLSSFIWLARIENKTIKISIATIFAVLQVILFAFFAQRHFVS